MNLSAKVFNIKNLSPKAFGILCYLILYKGQLNKPVHEKTIVKHFKSTAGRKQIASGFKELKEKGYIQRHTYFNTNHQFTGSCWLINL